MAQSRWHWFPIYSISLQCMYEHVPIIDIEVWLWWASGWTLFVAESDFSNRNVLKLYKLWQSLNIWLGCLFDGLSTCNMKNETNHGCYEPTTIRSLMFLLYKCENYVERKWEKASRPVYEFLSTLAGGNSNNCNFQNEYSQICVICNMSRHQHEIDVTMEVRKLFHETKVIQFKYM